MRKVIIAVIVMSVLWLIYFINFDSKNMKLAILKQETEKIAERPQVVDHSKFAVLQKDFKSGQEVTEACLSCHTERHKELLNSSHFKWEREEYIKGRGIVSIGKKNLINNFCIGIAGSEGMCNKCHAGYGWADTTFNFDEAHNIDCLVCHDNSGDYKKGNMLAGNPAPEVDLAHAATNVGLPKKENCGSCHFLSGGGNNVKHGDLEMALVSTTKNIDVHMGQDGADMECIVCHTAENHNIKGKMYSVSSMNENRVECESCHSESPHSESILNEHTVKVGCQTCHIPKYAKVNSTKMHWDWSKACKTMDPNYHETDSLGNHVYLGKKGRFVWQRNVVPEYVFFNGTADHYLMGDKIPEGAKVVNINTLNGSYADKDSKIIPVKIHRTSQPYDPVNRLLIQPKLWDAEYGNKALWVDCKTTPIVEMWGVASKAGMDYIGLPYSGKYDFINSAMYWPVNHMVSEADSSLTCNDCHVRENGRLEQLSGFYMPGRDYNSIIDFLGIFTFIASIAGIAIHAIIRVITYNRNK